MRRVVEDVGPTEVAVPQDRAPGEVGRIRQEGFELCGDRVAGVRTEQRENSALQPLVHLLPHLVAVGNRQGDAEIVAGHLVQCPEEPGQLNSYSAGCTL